MRNYSNLNILSGLFLKKAQSNNNAVKIEQADPDEILHKRDLRGVVRIPGDNEYPELNLNSKLFSNYINPALDELGLDNVSVTVNIVNGKADVASTSPKFTNNKHIQKLKSEINKALQEDGFKDTAVVKLVDNYG